MKMPLGHSVHQFFHGVSGNKTAENLQLKPLVLEVAAMSYLTP